MIENSYNASLSQHLLHKPIEFRKLVEFDIFGGEMGFIPIGNVPAFKPKVEQFDIIVLLNTRQLVLTDTK